MSIESFGKNEWIDEQYPERGLESKIEQIPIELDPNQEDLLECMKEIFEIADKLRDVMDDPEKAEKLEEIANFLDRLGTNARPSTDEIRDFRDKISAWK